LYSIGLDEFFGKEGVTIVEWSERLLQPVNQAIEVRLEDAGDDMRVFHVCLPVLNKRTGLLSNVEKSANGNIGKRSRRAR
jgi:tRNA A37 threonylcarbamoyladenosine biosynthesis protein TsaE